ncbi:hypothetical protein [Pasteurella canis]|uniref:hypothetical protein n=1 Tax=Pasteurella canis TaxID=753 RepID=UPI001CBC5E5C|nr:hypothetical protein [Pasteurella canis]
MFKVSDTSSAMAKLHSRVHIIDDLLGGTERMREASKTYLPKFPLEDNDAYKNRLERTTLYPALEETLSQMNGRVFLTQLMLQKSTTKLLLKYSQMLIWKAIILMCLILVGFMQD